MNNAKSRVNIVILDACRDNPYMQSFRSTTRGLAIIAKAPMGTLVAYSTSPGDVAHDGKGRNSPYTSSLLQYMNEPGLNIEQVFKNTRKKLIKDTDGKQVPWELSSLQGDFFFMTGSVKNAIGDENRKLDEEHRHLTAEREALDNKRRDVEEERHLLAVEKEKQSQAYNEREQTKVKERGRDDPFIAYSDGTVLDTTTNLIWAEKDNGRDITWENARQYCNNYRGGGYSDWRIPTEIELKGLYDEKRKNQNLYNITKLIKIERGRMWAAKQTMWSQPSGICFDSYRGGMSFSARNINDDSFSRVLPVRSVKIEVGRDGRFIAYNNGTVLDTRTNLMWAARDNGSDIIYWRNAKRYCESYRGGDYEDWRMPSWKELAGLFDGSKSQKVECGTFPIMLATDYIYLTCWWTWASETDGSKSSYTNFSGRRDLLPHPDNIGLRALPVRNAK